MEKSEFVEHLKKRTKKLATDIILFYDVMKKNRCHACHGKTVNSFGNFYSS